MRVRQEVLNTALSELIGTRGIEATPERVIMKSGKHMPDVLFRYNGLCVVVECEVGGVASARQKAILSAQQRVEEGIADVAVGLVYSPELAEQADVAKIKKLMQSGEPVFEVAVVTESVVEPFAAGNFEFLFSMLHAAWQRLLTEDMLSQAVEEIDQAVESFADALNGYEGITEKLAETLGIQGAPDKRAEGNDE